MDIISVELIDFPVLPDLGVFDRKAGSAYDVVGRNGDRYTVNAEIAVKLGIAVILVQIPALFLDSARTGRLIHADLGEPLPGHDEAAGLAHAGKNLRQGDLELKLQRHALSAVHRLGKMDLDERAVVFIAVIGPDILHPVEQRDPGLRPDVGKRHGAEAVLGHSVAAQLASRFGHEGCVLRTEGVRVEVEVQVADRILAGMRPGYRLGCGHGACIVRQLRPDVILGNPAA
ncbi:hypothetical protein D3C71_1490730 [compost metagenome]